MATGIPAAVAQALVRHGYGSMRELERYEPMEVAQQVPEFMAWSQARAFGPDSPGGGAAPPWEKKAPPPAPTPSPLPYAAPRSPSKSARASKDFHFATRPMVIGVLILLPATLAAYAYETGPPLTAELGFYPPVFYCAKEPCQRFSFDVRPRDEPVREVRGLRLSLESDLRARLQVFVADVERWNIGISPTSSTPLFEADPETAQARWTLEFSSENGDKGWIRIHEAQWFYGR